MLILPASKWSFALLIHHDNPPHKKNNAKNPPKNAAGGLWSEKTATKNTAGAILHHGRNKQAQNASPTISIIINKNFMRVALNYKFNSYLGFKRILPMCFFF